jgi:hypothetical protein
VSSVLRHYDSELIRGLQRRGFEVYGTQVVLVRDLTAKVRLKQSVSRKKTVLIHAHLARSAPTDTSPSLRVLSGTRARSSPR